MDRNWRVLLIAGVISLCSAQFVFASYSLGDSGGKGFTATVDTGRLSGAC